MILTATYQIGKKQNARASSSAGQTKDARAFIVCMCSYACFRMCFDAPFHCFFKGGGTLAAAWPPGQCGYSAATCSIRYWATSSVRTP